MISKTILVLSAALVAVTTLVSSADAQRASGPAAMPFTQAEQNWFDIAEGPERLPK
ncbi:MAG: hypothetical protein IT536_12560 [Hyphomicrobiales bacterium]|nr:hypothetical protein [Hyphomicrobiales bacterium]